LWRRHLEELIHSSCKSDACGSVSRPCKSRRGGLVRLRTHPHSGVEVPVRPTIHRPVTEGYCVVATQGGELPEVNCQSVTEPLQSKGNVNSIRQAEGTSPSWRSEVRAAACASERGFLREQERPAEQRLCAEATGEPEEK